MRSRVGTHSAAGLLRPTAVALGVGWAFLSRGIATALSYRARLSLGLASVVLSAVTFILIGRVVAASGPGFVERFGVDYTTFVVVGVVVHGVASSGLRSFRAALRREQLQGTLEALLASPVPLPIIVTLSGAGELAVTAVGGAAFLALASLLAGLHLTVSAPMVAGAVLYVAFMSGVGLASAGFVLVSKEGDPISWLIGSATGLLGGVYFPVELLPAWLARAAAVLPTTRALELARSGLGAAGPQPTASALVGLAAVATLSITIGLLLLRWGHRHARRHGTLAEY
jgi:ABC-2 type transport system permease protein